MCRARERGGQTQERDRTRDGIYRPYHGAPSPSPAQLAPLRRRPRCVRTARWPNMLSSRCGAPPPSSLSPDVPPLPLPRRSDDSVKSSTSTGSPSSASASSGTPSTFLDRMKGCGGYGIVYGYGNEYGLSRTNVEEEPELGSEEGREWGGGWLPCSSRSGAYFRAARWLSPLMDEVLIMVCFGKRIETTTRCLEASQVTT